MTILNILHYPDPRLRKKALPVSQVDETVKRLVEDMFETMYQAPGIGLAATQADIQKRIIVIDISEHKNEPLCFINPEIIRRDGVEEMEEGCLSVPGIYERVERAEQVIVRALDREGESFDMQVSGLLSACIQHEMDHLEGKLFVDYLSELKRQRIRKKMDKLRQKMM
ncbi:MAG: peptide deformylase [Gammaproteobacteria bacterium]|nr:peptide deformylase [Gammaproteobacteria bacterium]